MRWVSVGPKVNTAVGSFGPRWVSHDSSQKRGGPEVGPVGGLESGDSGQLVLAGGRGNTNKIIRE